MCVQSKGIEKQRLMVKAQGGYKVFLFEYFKDTGLAALFTIDVNYETNLFHNCHKL